MAVRMRAEVLPGLGRWRGPKQKVQAQRCAWGERCGEGRGRGRQHTTTSSGAKILDQRLTTWLSTCRSRRHSLARAQFSRTSSCWQYSWGHGGQKWGMEEDCSRGRGTAEHCGNLTEANCALPL